jgi:hypothetical protein
MKNGYFITFLLTGFFILAFGYAGNTAFNKKQSSTTFFTQVHAYPNADQDHLPAILAVHHFFVSAASASGNGTQKIINCHKLHSSALNYSIPGNSFPVSVNEFLRQKKYLFYIYPSHNFW